MSKNKKLFLGLGALVICGIITVGIVLVVVLVLPFYDKETKIRTAVDSYKNLKTAEVSLTANYKISIEYQGQNIDQNLSMTGNGLMDAQAKTASIKYDIDSQGIKGSMEQYVDGKKSYMKVGGKWNQGAALTDSQSQDELFGNSPLKLLSLNNNYKFVGEETIDGNTYYDYNITLDQAASKSFTQQIVAGVNSSSPTAIKDEDLDLKSIDYSLKVNKTTGQPYQEKIVLNVDVKFPNIGTMKLNPIELIMTYKSINSPVTITRPSDLSDISQ